MHIQSVEAVRCAAFIDYEDPAKTLEYCRGFIERDEGFDFCISNAFANEGCLII